MKKKTFKDVSVGDKIYFLPKDDFMLDELKLPELIKITVASISIDDGWVTINTDSARYYGTRATHNFPEHIRMSREGIRFPKKVFNQERIESREGICLASKESYNKLLKARLEYELKRIDDDIRTINQKMEENFLNEFPWYKRILIKIKRTFNYGRAIREDNYGYQSKSK